MIQVEAISAAEEKALLDEWFATVHFDEESEGIPDLEPEEDDEEPQTRSVEIPTNTTISDLALDDLMAELRKREPDNPF